MTSDRGSLAGSSDSTRRLICIVDKLVSRFPGQGWGVRELAEEIGASRSTVNRLLQALVEHRLARVDRGSTYHVGPRLRVVAGMVHRSHPVLREGPRVLSQLTRRSGATAMAVLQGPDPTESFVAVVHQAPGSVHYRLTPGMRLPLHAGAAGQAILMQVGVDGLSEAHLEGFTEATCVDLTALRQAVDEARARGFVTSIGQHIPLAAGVAAPFRTADGEVGAVSATRPRSEASEAELEEISVEVLGAVEALASSEHVALPERVSARPRPGRSSTAGRVERLMTLLAEGSAGLPPLSETARALAAHTATTRKLIASAVDAGIARHSSASDSIVRGPLLTQWAAHLGPRPALSELLDPYLRSLSTETGETTALVILDPEALSATIAGVANGRNPVHYGVEEGVQVPLHAGASGKSLLAHLPPSTADQLTLQRFAPGTLTTPTELRADLRVIRERGWAVGEGERFQDAFGLAAPVFDGSTVVAAISITIPRFRKEDLDLDSLVSALLEVSEDASSLISV